MGAPGLPDTRPVGVPSGQIERETFFLADAATAPRTWDTVDRENDIVVCSPHTPDPVLFGIRGQSPLSVALARTFIRTEPPGLEQIFLTNQGTDGHLEEGIIGELTPGPLIPCNGNRYREGGDAGREVMFLSLWSQGEAISGAWPTSPRRSSGIW